MKFLAVAAVLLISIALVSAEDPEKWSADTYTFIHGFKGTKEELFVALKGRIETEMKGKTMADINPINVLR
jgi:hypothetical protein